MGRTGSLWLALVGLILPIDAQAENWSDRFYQFRLPIVTESEQAGWQQWPLDAQQITAAINKIGPFRFDPRFFAFSQPFHMPGLIEHDLEIDFREEMGLILIRWIIDISRRHGKKIFSIEV